MPSIVIDDADRLRQLWTQLVTDVTPSHLPSGLFSKRETKSTVGCISVPMSLPAIHDCCQKCDVSPLNVVQAAWTAVLRSYSGADNVMFAGIGMNPRSTKHQWTNTSVSLARLEQDSSVISVLDTTQEEGLLQAESMVSVTEALHIFSTLEPKPCNSAIWLKDSESKSELSPTDVVNDKAVSNISSTTTVDFRLTDSSSTMLFRSTLPCLIWT
jgi:hypothetical protein